MFRKLLDSPWPYFVGAALLILVALATQFDVSLPKRSTGQPADLATLRDRDDLNVVFVTVDTMRADRIGCYGYERNTTPNMDTLARYGVRFDDVVAQSTWTKASMASMWTGTYPSNNGILRFRDALPPEAVMPAEILKKAGFRTAGIYRNGWVAPNFGFDQGFDMYLHPTPGRAQRATQARRPEGEGLPGSDEDALIAAREFLGHFRNDRFLLYIHMMDLHQYVYDETAPNFGPSYSDAYDQALHWADRVIGLLVNDLGELDLLDKTILVITSDHGEAFQEHGYEGHARNLYHEVVQVPWIISLPFALDPGIVVEERVENIDVWPTILDLLGIEGLSHPDGRSLVPTLMGVDGPPPRPFAVSQLDRFWGQNGLTKPLVAVIDGSKRLMYWPNKDQPNELYDTDSDPAESRNVFDAHDPEAKRLLDIADHHYRDTRNPWGRDKGLKVEIDELRLNQLRALGYEVGGR